MSTGAIVWFRQDLRLRDNPALQAAAKLGGPIVPVYILCDAAGAGISGRRRVALVVASVAGGAGR